MGFAGVCGLPILNKLGGHIRPCITGMRCGLETTGPHRHRASLISPPCHPYLEPPLHRPHRSDAHDGDSSRDIGVGRQVELCDKGR